MTSSTHARVVVPRVLFAVPPGARCARVQTRRSSADLGTPPRALGMRGSGRRFRLWRRFHRRWRGIGDGDREDRARITSIDEFAGFGAFVVLDFTPRGPDLPVVGAWNR